MNNRDAKMKIFFFCLFLCFGIIYAEAVLTPNIEKRVKNYFSSAGLDKISDVWNKYKQAIQHSIQLVLKETYGDQGMNVYIRKSADLYKLSDGFLASDNIVQVLFKDLYLTQFPRLSAPEVTFELPSNVLKVDADVGKMFIETDYLLFRNLSDIVYSSATVDPYKKSPFSLHEVKNVGEAAIVAEGCVLSGFAVTSLLGQSVHLGHDNFRISKCKFSVEISGTPGTDSPPVIAPYFSPEQGMELELLLLKPIKEELVPKLQGAVFTFVNTSAMFRDNLPSIRNAQRKVFKKTLAFMAQAVTYQNQIIAKRNGGVDKLHDLTILWKDMYNLALQETRVQITNVSVSGLDSVYSAQVGGPYKMPDLNMVDTVRVGAIQVVGDILLGIGDSESQYVFYGEIQDVSVYVSLGIETLSLSSKKSNSKESLRSSLPVGQCIVEGWRNLDIHAPILPDACEICKQAPKALITGFLLNELPKLLMQHISESFSKAVLQTDQAEENVDKSMSAENDNNEYNSNDKNDQSIENGAKVDNLDVNAPSVNSEGNDGNEDKSQNLSNRKETGNGNFPEKSNENTQEQHVSDENVGSDIPSDVVNSEDNRQDVVGTDEIQKEDDENKSENGQVNDKKSSEDNANRRRAVQSDYYTKKPPSQFLNVHWSDNEIHS